MIDIVERHGQHSLHYANVKYGYILLFISLLYFCGIVLMENWRVNRFISQKTELKKVFILPIIIGILILISLYLPFLHEFAWGTFLKRFGRLSYSLVPLDLLLILRPNVINYLNLIPFHKWVSRVILSFGLIHGLGFLIKWCIEGVFFAKIFEFNNSIGIGFVLCFSILLFVSLRFVRKFNYLLFYLFHNFTILILIAFIGLHARPGVTPLTVINVILLIFQILFKFNILNVNVKDIKNFKNLSLIVIEKPSNYPVTLAGSHLRLQVLGWKHAFLPAHPYTVIDDGNNLNLVISKTNKTSVSIHNSNCITFPYNSIGSLHNYIQANKNITMFIGGSGISFALSLIRYYPNFKFNLIWCIRDRADLDLLNYYPELNISLDVYVTRIKEDGVDIELDDIQEHLLDNNEEAKDSKFNVNYGRPNLGIYNADLLIACGPLSLMKDAAAFAKARNIKLIKEYYGF